MNSRVRIYDGGERSPDSTIIGFSNGSEYVRNFTTICDFFDQRDYQIIMAPTQRSESIPYEDFAVRPPMSDEHVQEFGKLCVKTIDAYHNSVIVLDHRNEPIEEVMLGGTIVAEG